MSSCERHWVRRCTGLVVFGTVACAAGAARAHIDLATPTPREHGRRLEPNSNLKQGPCGQIANGRTDKVNVFAPGETIEVTWAEITNHRSYYRVAFDRSGDDAFPTFEGPGTGAEGIDPSGPCPVDGQVILAYDMDDRNGGNYTLSVRLPDVECESCTLQLVQFMYDTRSPYYFQCADLALRRPAAGDAGAATTDRRDGGPDASALDADVGREASAAPGCWSRIAPLSAPMSSDDGNDGNDGPAPPSANGPSASQDPLASEPAAMVTGGARRSDDGMCSLDPLTSSRASGLPTLLLWAASWVVARTRRVARKR
jgi:hypothetical protein